MTGKQNGIPNGRKAEENAPDNSEKITGNKTGKISGNAQMNEETEKTKTENQNADFTGAKAIHPDSIPLENSVQNQKNPAAKKFTKPS